MTGRIDLLPAKSQVSTRAEIFDADPVVEDDAFRDGVEIEVVDRQPRADVLGEVVLSTPGKVDDPPADVVDFDL